MSAPYKNGIPNWSVKDSEDYYGLKRWGGGHFSIDSKGFMQVHPLRDQLYSYPRYRREAAEGAKATAYHTYPRPLAHACDRSKRNFPQSDKDENYAGRYRGVFPMESTNCAKWSKRYKMGKPFNYGLECGSKPELMLALAMHKDPKALIICNGYKDDEFIRLALEFASGQRNLPCGRATQRSATHHPDIKATRCHTAHRFSD